LLPETKNVFEVQCEVLPEVANELGLTAGTPISYRAGDQPNNAFSLNVLEPGEIAATAGTSGVVYAVSDQQKYDPDSRVNIFAHVNHTKETERYGILLCINGTGILNSWINKYSGNSSYSYEEMNNMANETAIGSDGLIIIPFGNGAERVLNNKETGAQISNINFNIHSHSHIFRATQEGIAFSFNYGIKIMQIYNGVSLKTIKAGNANMFLSDIFRNTLAGVTKQPIEIYDTDGAVGAARGAGIGAGIYKSTEEAFESLERIMTIEPQKNNYSEYQEAYNKWENALNNLIN
jgi:xylulokinase